MLTESCFTNSKIRLGTLKNNRIERNQLSCLCANSHSSLKTVMNKEACDGAPDWLESLMVVPS